MALGLATIAALGATSVASADITQKVKIPLSGDASIVVTPLKPNGGKPTVRVKNRSSLPSSLIVLGGVGKHNGKTYGTIVVVNRKAATARAAQNELIFVGYHRALKGKGPPGVANSVINNTAASASFNRLCKSGSGIFNYAIDYLKPKPLLGNLFGGYASQAIGKFVAKDACDKAYPQKGKWQGDVNGCGANPRGLARAATFTCQGGGGTSDVIDPEVMVKDCHPTPGMPPSYERMHISGKRHHRGLRDATVANDNATVTISNPDPNNMFTGPTTQNVRLDAGGNGTVQFQLARFGTYTYTVTITAADGTNGSMTASHTVQSVSDCS